MESQKTHFRSIEQTFHKGFQRQINASGFLISVKLDTVPLHEVYATALTDCMLVMDFVTRKC